MGFFISFRRGILEQNVLHFLPWLFFILFPPFASAVILSIFIRRFHRWLRSCSILKTENREPLCTGEICKIRRLSQFVRDWAGWRRPFTSGLRAEHALPTVVLIPK